MMMCVTRLKLLLLVLVVALAPAAVHGAARLGEYNVDKSQTTVSGLSSGGYMAIQLQVAFDWVRGSAIFAGGPYNCAQGAVNTALTTCMQGSPAPNVNAYVTTTNNRARQGTVAAKLSDIRAYLFSGKQDTTVTPKVMDALNSYLQQFVTNGKIIYKADLAAAHTQPTDDPAVKNSCAVSTAPYISNCNFDGAGEAFRVMYDNLSPRVPYGTGLTGTFVEFDQTEFVAASRGMASTGWLYVPASCARGEPCRLHISLHGCKQGTSAVGMAYVQDAGYNRWADTNRILVMYPQATTSSGNPNGCWDWWGYNSNAATYDLSTGLQMAAIDKMATRVGAGKTEGLQPPADVRSTGRTEDSVDLAWSAAAGATNGYEVVRDGQSVGTTQTTTFSDKGLQANTRYTYEVHSRNETHKSEPSPPLQVTTRGGPAGPDAPENLRLRQALKDSITIAWDATDGATSYVVYRNGSAAGKPTGLEFTDSGLQPATQYTYRVAGTDGQGVEGELSETLTVSTAPAWECNEYTTNNYQQVAAGRAYTTGGYVYALGSDQSMGLYNTFVTNTLAEVREKYFVVGLCSSY